MPRWSPPGRRCEPVANRLSGQSRPKPAPMPRPSAEPTVATPTSAPLAWLPCDKASAAKAPADSPTRRPPWSSRCQPPHVESASVGASALGAGYGSLVGALVPTLANAAWGGWQRDNQAGLLVGLPASAIAGSPCRTEQASGADGRRRDFGSVLGLGMGVGLGLLWPDNYSQPARIGALAGTTAGWPARSCSNVACISTRAWATRPGLASPAPRSALPRVCCSRASSIRRVRSPSTSTHAIAGGVLLGGSAGLASGLLLSKYHSPAPKNLATAPRGTRWAHCSPAA